MSENTHVEAVRAAFAAALRGDVASVGDLLADDVQWHAVGDDTGGCQNRRQAMGWIGESLARGMRADLLDVRALDEDRVLVLLQRNPRRDGETDAERPSPHGQIISFRDGKIVEIAVYASDSDALDAAVRGDAAV